MKIVFIAPDREAEQIYRESLPKSEDIEVISSILGEALVKAKEIEEKRATVFAAFGATALILKVGGIVSPVVEIKLTSREMVQAIGEACDLVHSDNPHIAVVAFINMIENLLEFQSLLSIQLNCHTITCEAEALLVVDKALADGAQVILGGAIIKRIATERRVPVVVLRPGESSIRAAYREAERIAWARRLDDHRSNELKAILEYAHEGIVAINSEQRITVFNPVAQSITGIKSEDALGRLSHQILPLLQFEEVLRGREYLGQIVDFGHSKVMMNRIPVQAMGKVVGAIATFQDVTHIQSMEAKIRHEIYSKGHIAKFSFQDIVSRSPVLQATLEKALRYAIADATVLIYGETGVGKELFAQGIHRASRRKEKPFVAVNCAALPESLLESELFGYVEGAFTGARRQGKPGLFELAHGGTIFLDEISEIPLSLQGRLLRVLQEREVVRLGHDRVIPIDVRVLCATNRDLHKLAEEGSFRNDLYWRLNVLSLSVPPLRMRTADIPPLIETFLKDQGKRGSLENYFTDDAIHFLMVYPWPGNVRELINFCERIMVDPPAGQYDENSVRVLFNRSTPLSIESMTKNADKIESAILQTGGKVVHAAKLLGIHRSTLWRRRKKLRQDQTM